MVELEWSVCELDRLECDQTKAFREVNRAVELRLIAKIDAVRETLERIAESNFELSTRVFLHQTVFRKEKTERARGLAVRTAVLQMHADVEQMRRRMAERRAESLSRLVGGFRRL